jgi:type II secretory pathway pseudopilin PulG
MLESVSMAERSDDGISLIEVLVAIALLGIAVVTIISGILTSIVTSDTHRNKATAETVLRGYAEAMRDYAQANYSSCATSYPATLVFTPPTGFTPKVNGVDYLGASGWVAQPAPTCGTTDTIQRLRLEVDATNGRATETVQIVIRRSP